MRSRVRLCAALAVLLLASSHPARVSAADAPMDQEGLGRLMRYAACALATFIARTPEQMGQAMIGCGLIYLDEVPTNP